MRRRRLLKLGGATVPAAFAGCITTSEESDEAGQNETEETAHQETDDETGSSRDDPADDDSEGASDDSDEWTEPDWPTGPYADYDTTIVEITDEDGEKLGRVKAAVAHPGEQWTLGLSDAESMPANAAMLFESDSESDLTFWMRNMDFGLDIVYVGADRRITSIHHAPEPTGDDDGTEPRYQFAGYGQYVLEVNYMWTSERGISEGDRLGFDL